MWRSVEYSKRRLRRIVSRRPYSLGMKKEHNCALEPERVERSFLTIQEVAAYFQVGVAQVYSLIRSGELPAMKIGGRGIWRVDPERIEALVQRLHEETANWVRAHPLIENADRALRWERRPRPPPDNAEVMPTVQAAEAIGVTREQVNQLVLSGRLRAYRAGRRWLVCADDVRAYRPLGEGRVKAGREGA